MASAEAERKVEKFAAMSPAELRAHEREAIRGVLDLELIPPVVETAPDQSVYGFAKLDFAMNGGMAQTPGGRLYAVWFAGADGFIHVVHDRERTKAREILHHRFTEADVRAGRLVTPGSRLKGIVNKAGPK